MASLGEELEALGYFRYAKEAEVARLRVELSFVRLAFETATRRVYHADAEDLAEGDVLNLLGRVAPFLRHEGVRIEVEYAEVRVPASGQRPAGRGRARLDADGWVDDEGPEPYVERLATSFHRDGPVVEVTEGSTDDAGGDYLLFAGGRRIVIWADGDEEDGKIDDWRRTAKATLGLLDELLAAHGSPERAHAIYEGNDLTVVFATPEMARLIDAAAPTPGARLHDGGGPGEG